MPILAQNQTPAHNIDCEVAILGGILQDTTAMGRVVNLLSPEHFYVPAHQKIYEVALTLHSKGQPTDYMVVTNYLKTHGKLESVGGTQQILSLIDQTVSAVNIERYCQIVWEYWWIRRQYELSSELTALSSQSHEFDFVRTQTLEKVSQLSQHLALKTGGSSGDRMVRVQVAIEELFNSQKEEEGINRRTLFDENYPLFDEHYPIFGEGVLTGILAPTGAGKSQTLSWMYCQHLRRYPDYPIAFFSLEMPRKAMAARYVASSCQIPITTILRGEMTREQSAKYWEYAPIFNESNAYVDDTPGEDVTADHIRSQIDFIIRETGKAPVVFLDYAQLMGGDGSQGETLKMIEISRNLKNIASRYKIPIIFAIQANRNWEQRNDKRPMIGDISWGGKLSQDADGIFGLYGEWLHDSNVIKNHMEWINLKNRHGISGREFTVHMSYNPSINFFAPLNI